MGARKGPRRGKQNVRYNQQNRTDCNNHKISTINAYVVRWYIIVGFIGIFATCMMFYTMGIDGVRYKGILIAFAVVFTAVIAIAVIGFLRLLIDHIQLKRVLSHGRETEATFLDWKYAYSTGKSVTRIGMLPTEANRNYRIIYKYREHGSSKWIGGKSNAIFNLEQVKKLKEMRTFHIKYIGKKSLIIEKI